MSAVLKVVCFFSLFQTVFSALIVYSPDIKKVGKPGASWIQNGNYFYLFSDEVGKSYFEASAYCRSFGAQLTSIVSQEETDFINNYINSHSGLEVDVFWIGAYKRVKTRYSPTYFLDGNPSSYQNWHFKDPDNTDSCIRLQQDFWMDKPCQTTKYGSICKKGNVETKAVSMYLQKKLTDKWVEGLSLLVVENKYCSRLYCASLCLRKHFCEGYNFRKNTEKCSCELKGSESYLTFDHTHQTGSSYWE